MRYRLRDLPSLLRSEQGRKSLFLGQVSRFWPLLRIYAAIYRRTILRNVRLIAVAGSLGKTTTARAAATALGSRIPDKVSNRKETLALDLLSYSGKDHFAVLEVGLSGPGIMRHYASMLDPDIAIITSIASEHILSFKTLENTRNEKADMLRSLGPEKTAILNADDPNVMWMASQTRARVITCGFSSAADIRASEPEFNSDGKMTFNLHHMGRTWPLSCSIPGRHMVFPFLAAAAAALAEKKDIRITIANLEKMQPAEGRMQPVQLPSGALLIRDDFKSNRESLQAALETLAGVPAERRILVLGGVAEISSRDGYDYYRELGRRIAASADHALLFLHKNAFRRCRNEAVAAGLVPDQIVRVSGNPLNALPLLPADLEEGDVILVKGKNEFRASRISLRLMGINVKCRQEKCRLAVDCRDCELREQEHQTSPLLRPSRV